MSIPHAPPTEIVAVGPLGEALASAKTTTLVKTDDLKLTRLVLPAGKEIPTHKAAGEIVVQCLEGQIDFTAEGKTQRLAAGQLLYLEAGEPHALKCLENASVLVTHLLRKSAPPERFDVVEEASEDSFPASDPPARSPVTRV
jgi:quercetin dioxygenase-like cupin family protein